MDKKKKNFFYLLLFVAIVILGIAYGIFHSTIKYTKNRIMESHDAHLYDLGFSVDKNIYDGLHNLKEEIDFALTRKRILSAEKEFEENQDNERLMQALNDTVFERFSFLKHIIIYHNNRYYKCAVKGEQCNIEILEEDSNGYGVCICEEDQKNYYLMIHLASSQSKFDYYMLIDLHNFFGEVVPSSIQRDNWVALYDEKSGLLIQNHKNQPSYIVLSKEEIQKREDGYTILMNHELKEMKGEQTYHYPNEDGSPGTQRIICIPSKMTQNGTFAIAIAVDSQHIFRQIHHIQYFMRLTRILNMVALLIIVYVFICGLLYQNKKQKELEIERMEKEFQKEIDELKINNSISQMQPHFLYNALSSIREIVLEEPDYAYDLIYDFTVHLRSCIRSMANNNLIPFVQELESIKAYANIEKMRFGDRLDIQYEIEHDDFEIVPLSIQPLVENAIRHGVFRKRKGGYVKISTSMTEEEYLLSVEDNGVGFDYEQVMKEIEDGSRDSTGLKNAILRLQMMLDAKIKVNSIIGEGTKITVCIPFNKEK